MPQLAMIMAKASAFLKIQLMFHKINTLFHMRIRGSRLLVFGFLLVGRLAHATDVVESWARHYQGPTGYDVARAVAVDASGKVFITGTSGDEFGVSDFATVAFSNAGIPLWTNRFNGSANGEDEGNAIAVDGSGNVFVTGFTETFSSRDFATIKYSNGGLPLWTNFYDGTRSSSDVAVAIAVDGNGKVYVSGRSDGVGEEDFLTIAYSNAGLPLWTNRYDGGSGTDVPRAMVIDSSSNIIVTGDSANEFNGFSDYATVAYSNLGIPLWTNRCDGPEGGDDVAYAVAADHNGNVFVTGRLETAGGDFTTIAYSNLGSPLWTNQYGLGPEGGRATAIAVGSNGNVIVTGYVDGNDLDYATIAYSGAGIPLWTNRYGGSYSDRAVAVAVDNNNNVFVTGYSNDSQDFSDFVTIAYSGAGVPLWRKSYGSGPDQYDTTYTKDSIAVTGIGEVVVVGYSDSANPDAETEYTVVKYSTVFPSTTPPKIIAALDGNNLELSWPASHKGWLLQSQTNPANTGIGTSWAAVADSPATNRMVFQPTEGSVFFRLIYPQ